MMAVIENFRTLTSAIVGRYQWMRQAGISFGGARDLYAVLGYDREISAKQYRDEYARGGIASRIVEAYPKATWRGGVELFEDEDPKKETPFEEAWKSIEMRLGIWSVLQRADILAGLSTYSVILIGAPGEFDQELPKGKPDQLLYLTPFSGGGGPNMPTIGASNYMDSTIAEFVSDAQDPRYGLPLTYQLRRMDIVSPGLQKPVHWSRVIHVAEGCLDNEVYGIPVLESVWNLLMDLLKVTGGGAEAFWLRANQGMQLNLEKDVELSADAAAKLKDEVDEYRHNISRVLKTRGMDVNVLGSDVANFQNPADAILTQIAGTKGIPKRILMGSEMGQLASGQDADNWATQVQDRRTGYAGPRIVRPLVDRLIQYGYLPTPKQYEVGWPVIESLKETEKSSGAAAWAGVNSAYGGIVFTDAEIREHFYGLEPLSEEDKAKATPQAPADPNAPQDPNVSEEGAGGAVPDTSVEGIMDALLTDAEEFRVAGGPGSGQQGHETPGQTPIPLNYVQQLHKAMTGNGIGSFKKTATEVAAALEHKNSQAAAKTVRVAGRKLQAAGFVPQKDGSFLHKDGRTATVTTGKNFKVDVKVSKKPEKVPEAKVDEPKVEKKPAEIKEAGPELRKKAIAKMKSAEAAAHEFSSTHVLLPNVIAKKLLAFAKSIPDSELAEDGRETTPHVTVKYGIHSNDVAEIRNVLSQVDGPIELTLGKTDYFEADGYDVVYVDVESQDLEDLNQELSAELEVTDTHDEYTPHATIAYVKSGLGEQYANDDFLEGKSAVLSVIEFCPKEGKTEIVDLGLRASEETELLHVLEAAIQADNGEVISAILGITNLGGPGSGPRKGGGSGLEDNKISGTKYTKEQLLDSAEKAGLSLYGPSNLDNQDEMGGTGLVFNRIDTTVELINVDSLEPEDMDPDETEGGVTSNIADDFEYQFFPSSNEGRDVSTERVRGLKPDDDGKIYLYTADYGIRIIDTKNKSKEIRTLGGPGSGNFGHGGRPGQIGGSSAGFALELGGERKREKEQWMKETAGKVDPKTGEQMKFVTWKAKKRREEKTKDQAEGTKSPKGVREIGYIDANGEIHTRDNRSDDVHARIFRDKPEINYVRPGNKFRFKEGRIVWDGNPSLDDFFKVGDHYRQYAGITQSSWDSYNTHLTPAALRNNADLRDAGGPGSGNFGHGGRPGQVGGSSSGGFAVELHGRLKAEKAEWQKETAGKVDPKTGEQMKFVTWKAMKRREQKAKEKAGDYDREDAQKRGDAEDKHFDDFNKEEKAKDLDREQQEREKAEDEKWRKKAEEEDERARQELKDREKREKERQKEQNKGGSGKSAKLEKAIDKSEEQIKDLRKEQLHILDKDGKLLSNLYGSKSRVRVDAKGHAAMMDPKSQITMVHNHPDESSLSRADLNCAAQPGVSSIIAVSSQGSRFEAEVLQPYGIKRQASAVDKQVTRSIGRLYYHKGDDLYRALGHLENLALHQRGVIKYTYRLSKSMQTALDRCPQVPAIKAALGLK